ncbi:hypothetical protein MOR12E_28900 [Methylobacterium oryzae]
MRGDVRVFHGLIERAVYFAALGLLFPLVAFCDDTGLFRVKLLCQTFALLGQLGVDIAAGRVLQGVVVCEAEAFGQACDLVLERVTLGYDGLFFLTDAVEGVLQGCGFRMFGNTFELENVFTVLLLVETAYCFGEVRDTV